MTFQLDETYIKNAIRTSVYEFVFKYNTNKDYFYFDLFRLDGTVVSLHNKIVANWGYEGFRFNSNTGASYANETTISSFTLSTDD